MKTKLMKYVLPFMGIIIACNLLQVADGKSPDIDQNNAPEFNELQVIEIVWNDLDPYTTSRNRSNWHVERQNLVTGESVAEIFEGEPSSGCWSGPEPVANMAISTTIKYWYVLMIPMPATPDSFYGTPSPTAPPLIPEPFLKQAHYLVNPETGEIIARKLICVVY